MSNWMDHLLRETLNGRAPATPPRPCLDAETAAAFADDMLSARERSRAEAHVADCARCQAMLAALARMTPPAAPRAWWRRRAMAWLAPIAVAATAILVWVNVPRPANVEPVVQTAREAARPAAPKAQHATPSVAPAERRSEPARDSVAARSAARRPVVEQERDRKAARNEVPAAPQPGTLPDSRVVAPSAAAEAPTALAEKMTVTGESARALPRRLDAAGHAVIVSSIPISRWRIGTDGVVYHTADGGATWETQSTGVNVTLAAGSSPSPSVCWLVGPSGIVVISTDEGRSWLRVPFPVAIDLVSVRATDDKTATVVTSDRRAFSTSDRGLNWSQE